MATMIISPRPYPHKAFEYKTLQDPNYCQWRVRRNSQQLQAFFIQITQTLMSSYAFTSGVQLQDVPYQTLFLDFFREMRGGSYLVRNAGWNLAKSLGYEDITTIENRRIDRGDYDDTVSTSYHVKDPFQDELTYLLDRCEGFNEKFLTVLKANSKRFIEGLSLSTRDTYFSSLPIFSRAFPRCYETLQSIFTDLLACEWLQEDINGIQDYTAEAAIPQKTLHPPLETTNWVLWCSALQLGLLQQRRDLRIAKQHEKAWQNDKDELLVSGSLALATYNPSYIGGQLVRVFFNAVARNTDPEGEDFYVQALPTLVGAGVVGASGFSTELLARLVFDIADLYSRHLSKQAGETPSRAEERGRNIAATFTKALLTGTIHGDDLRYLKEIFGGLLSEAMNQLPEADETTPWGRRVLRVALTNPDIQEKFINGLFDPVTPEPTTLEEPSSTTETTQDDDKQTQAKTEERLARETAEKEKQLAIEEEQKKADEQHKKDLAKYQQDLAVYEQQVAHIQAVEGAVTAIKQCQRAVRIRGDRLQERLESLQKRKHKDSLYRKAVNQVKKYNADLRALDQAINHYNALTGNPERVSTPKMKTPQRPSLDDRLASLLEAIGFQSINVSVSAPLYPTKAPQLTDRQTPHDAPPPPKPTEPTRPQPRKPAPETATPTITTTFQDVQALQRQKQFETNMAFTSTPQPLQPSAPIDWGRGVARKAQQTPLSREPRPTRIPRRSPMQIQHGSFGTAQMMNQTEAQIIQNVVNNDFLKSIPKGTVRVASSVLSMMLPDMSKTGAECPKQHVKRVMTNILKRYDQVVHVQNPHGLPAKAGEFVGEMFAFGVVGRVVRVAEGVSIFVSACEGGLYGAILSETHDTNRAAGIAFGFAGGGATTRILFKRDVPRPLIDRVFARPKRPSRQLQTMQDFQRPTYHSGIGSPWSEIVPAQQQIRRSTQVAATRLTDREVSRITPVNLPYLQKGVDLEWFMLKSPKIDALRRTHDDPKRFYAALRSEFAPQNLSELKIRRTLKYAGFDTYPRPEGLPTNVIVEFADKNGGMVYRLAGSTNKQNQLVRICPGFAKESIVSSVIKGRIERGTLRQQYPYVVQCKGKYKLTIHGEWIETGLPENKAKEALTHIPLHEFKFRGWE